jgi:hypothetical protein
LLGAQESNAEFKRTLAALNAGAFRAGVGTYQAIGQGLDVPPVSVAVCTTPVASHKQLFGQVRGRVCRTHEGKKSARAYVIHDLLVFGKKAIVDLTKWNRRVVVWSQGAWTPAEEYLQSLAA